MIQLSKHISLDEMVRTSVRLPNDPLPVHVEAMRELAVNVLDPIRDHFSVPLIVTSGFRCSAVNARVGGQPNSQHRKGEAADFHLLGQTGYVNHFEIGQWVIDSGLLFDQMILEFCGSDGSSGWVHISYVSRRTNRRSAKVAEWADRRVHYRPPLQGEITLQARAARA